MDVDQLTHRPAPGAENTSASKVDRQASLAAGGIVGALASSSCCILPVVPFSLGASGAWLGNLSALSPYQPIFVAITLGFLAGGFLARLPPPRGGLRRVCSLRATEVKGDRESGALVRHAPRRGRARLPVCGSDPALLGV